MSGLAPVRVALPLLAFLCAPAYAQTIMVWGNDSCGQLSTAPAGDFIAVAGGSSQGLALRKDRTPFLWGGVVGLCFAAAPPIPAELAAERFRAVSLGRQNAVLIRQDGTLAAFGLNPPVTSVPPGTYQAIAVAFVHAVAIAEDGTLKAWGSDSSGTLTGLLNAPQGGPFKAIAANTLYSLALRDDGTLLGWGHGANGINVLDTWTPTPEDPNIFYVPGETFKVIAAGNDHALAIRSDGTVMGWGNAASGALDAPTHVRFKAIAAGWGFSIGLSTDGMLWGWGTPFEHPLFPGKWTFESAGWTRYGDSNHYYIPDERFKSIEAAAFHVMAITR